MRRSLMMAGVGAAGVVLAVALGVGGGSDPLAPSERSSSATTVVASPTTTVPERAALPMLVLYDTSGEWSTVGRSDAILSANLLGHFGPVTSRPMQEYTAGMMAGFAGVVYEGSTFDEPLPAAFLDDVAAGGTPTVWAGLNIWQLADRLTAGGYGFNTANVDPREFVKVEYSGEELDRQPTGASNGVVPITVTDPTVATSVGTIVAEDGSRLPWAVHARNLTYVSESPYSFMAEGDRYLAWGDVLLGAFTPDVAERHRAVVRLEDIGPASDPKLLRASIDVLVQRRIPFTMAVYPLFMDPKGANGTAYGSKKTPALRLDETPDVVAAIAYGLDHGGTIVSHGLTHQYLKVDNPYDGVSGNDFEFYRAHVDAATDDVVLDGPVEEDAVDWAADRLRTARTMLAKAGIPLDQVRMFEPAHYTASDATYRAIGEVYAGLNGAGPAARFDRGMYFPPAASGGLDTANAFGQFFPYAVRDTYGQLVIPENLGNVIEVGYNNNGARTPAEIVANARRSMVVRDNVVGFFFHPYLDSKLLARTVDGIADAGYEFVPSTSVTTGWDMSGSPS